MQRRKAGAIGQAATLALLASVASLDAAEVAICSLVAKPSSFDRQAITFQGTATAVKKTTSRRGNDYTLFKLQGPGGWFVLRAYSRPCIIRTSWYFTIR
jgi:hypothetical protein